MKGIELPISTILILIIVLVVGITILYVFSGSLNPSANSVSLDIATKSICAKIILFTDRSLWARIPVDDFDANKNGKINDHTPDASYPTSYCIDDNLETLCGFYYGCRTGGCKPGGIDAGPNLVTDAEWEDWRQCCIVRICGK